MLCLELEGDQRLEHPHHLLLKSLFPSLSVPALATASAHAPLIVRLLHHELGLEHPVPVQTVVDEEAERQC